MLEKVLETSKYVVDNAIYVRINFNKINLLTEELSSFNSSHFATKLPYDFQNMNTKEIINFLLIYDSIIFSFWGSPKWTIKVNDKELDGGNALFHCIFNLFYDRKSEDIFNILENMTFEKFQEILKGNVEIPLLKERYDIVKKVAKIVNETMNSDFYGYIKDLTRDEEVFKVITVKFDDFEDTRLYKNKTIYFYKLAQLLTSDILHVLQLKEKKVVDCSHLVGCADYKIPQVLHGLQILEYDKELTSLIENKIPIEENCEMEIEIRASMIVVIDYVWKKIHKSFDRIDINNFIWSKGQVKTTCFKPYHLTRTTSY